MAKLFFRYSAMNAGKTLDLIKVAFNYSERNQKALILTSGMDSRAEINQVKSRTGFFQEAISTKENDNLFQLVSFYKNLSCLLVDEVHMFSIKQVDEISDIVDFLDLPVICYGLRTDYKGDAFPSSQRLLAIADTIEEVKTICHCGKKATFNLLVCDGKAIKEGPSLIADDLSLNQSGKFYTSLCRKHWKENIWK